MFDLNGRKCSLDLNDRATMSQVQTAAKNGQNVHMILHSGKSRDKKKCEVQGGLMKARLSNGKGVYATGDQYDRILSDQKFLDKFKANRNFIEELVSVKGLVNLVTPYLFACFLCPEEIQLDSSASLGERELNK